MTAAPAHPSTRLSLPEQRRRDYYDHVMRTDCRDCDISVNDCPVARDLDADASAAHYAVRG